jgi:HSP90 family molecular chaperone
MSSVMQGKKTLEINPDNNIIKALAKKLDTED